MSAQDELLLQMIMQAIPELSRGQYQPMDVGSEISNMSLLEDRLGNASNPLMAILNGTFDYGLLDPVSSFDEAAPDTALSDTYRDSGQYGALFQALDEGVLPDQAALMQFNLEFPDIDLAPSLAKGGTTHPRYESLVKMAESVAPDVAKRRAWEARRDAAPTTMSDTAKMFAEAALSSERTEDSYFSPDIDRLRADRAEQESAFAAAQAKYDLVGKELRGPTDAFDGVVADDVEQRQRPQTDNAPDQMAGDRWAGTGSGSGFGIGTVEQERLDVLERDALDAAGVRAKEVRGPKSSPVTNYGGNWRAADRDYEKSLKPRDATPAERQAIRSAADKRGKATDKAFQEEFLINHERSSGRTIQRDQMMNRLASLIMGR